MLNGGAVYAASYANATAGVTVSLLNPASNTGEATGDRYNLIENLIGSRFYDTLTGSTAANRLEGGDGNDSLTGSIGADDLVGGNGNDRFIYTAGAEVVAGESVAGGSNSGGFDGLVLQNAGSINFAPATLSGLEIVQFFSGTSACTGGQPDWFGRDRSGDRQCRNARYAHCQWQEHQSGGVVVHHLGDD